MFAPNLVKENRSMGKWCIGIDLGGTFIKFGLLNGAFQRSELTQLPTPSTEGGDGVIAQMVAGAKQLMAGRGLARDDIVGVGIGSPGPLDIDKGIIIETPNIPGMANLAIRDRVSAGLDLPAVLDNDANAAGYGEFLCGAGVGVRDMVLLTLGTGIGGGVIVNGKVLHGAHSMGAELGHMIVEPGGEQCGCGQKGCIERYSSATYIARHARRLVEEGRDSSLKKILDEKGELDAKDIQTAAQAGDELAAEVWDRGLYYLAIGCVSICRIFDPDRIVLAGGMTKAGDSLMTPLMKHFNRLHWTATETMTSIVLSQLGNDAGVIGSAGLAWDAFGDESHGGEKPYRAKRVGK